jgi:hypothetical protein
MNNNAPQVNTWSASWAQNWSHLHPWARNTIIPKTAVAGLKMAHLPKIALAFEHLHHFDRP